MRNYDLNMYSMEKPREITLDNLTASIYRDDPNKDQITFNILINTLDTKKELKSIYNTILDFFKVYTLPENREVIFDIYLTHFLSQKPKISLIKVSVQRNKDDDIKMHPEMVLEACLCLILKHLAEKFKDFKPSSKQNALLGLIRVIYKSPADIESLIESLDVKEFRNVFV